MDNVDNFMETAERDASPTRFPPREAEENMFTEHSELRQANVTQQQAQHVPLPTNDLERVDTASTTSSSAFSGRASRVETERMSRYASAGDIDRHPTELSRITTHRSQHAGTVGRDPSRTLSKKETKPLPAFGAGKPYPPPLPEQEEYVVEFDGPEDPLHPQNWPMKKKVALAGLLGYTTLLAAFASSVFSAAIFPFSAEFGVDVEVGTLGVSLYVMGFAFGPLLWAPFSELRGRREPIVFSMLGFSIFQIGVAAARDIQTAVICRFFGGLFAACPLAVVAAVFSDMFDNRTRGLAVTVFSMMVFTGPLLAPFIGGFIVQNPKLGWRWTEWIMVIFGFVAFGLNLFLLPESYPPVVLIQKAAELRRRTLNWGIHAKQEEIEVDFRELVTKNFSRPLRILSSELIVLLLSIYMAFIYGLLYLSLTAYPIVFQQIHGFGPGVGGLPFLGMVIGMLISGSYVAATSPAYNRKLEANNNIPVPEWRLPPVAIGGISFACGLFWFGWTGYTANIHWIVPTLAGLLLGFGLLSIFLQSLNYIVDAYLMFAASAIAANTFLRSLCGAIFPLFARYMFAGLGVNYACTLLGCVAFLLAPIPFLFMKYGPKIRAKSKFAPSLDLKQQKPDEEKGTAGIPNGVNGETNGSAPLQSEKSNKAE